MSLEKFLNVDIKKMKENNKKRQIEELEPTSKAMEDEIRLKKANKRRRDEYKLKKERKQKKDEFC